MAYFSLSVYISIFLFKMFLLDNIKLVFVFVLIFFIQSNIMFVFILLDLDHSNLSAYWYNWINIYHLCNYFLFIAFTVCFIFFFLRLCFFWFYQSFCVMILIFSCFFGTTCAKSIYCIFLPPNLESIIFPRSPFSLVRNCNLRAVVLSAVDCHCF